MATRAGTLSALYYDGGRYTPGGGVFYDAVALESSSGTVTKNAGLLFSINYSSSDYTSVELKIKCSYPDDYLNPAYPSYLTLMLYTADQQGGRSGTPIASSAVQISNGTQTVTILVPTMAASTNVFYVDASAVVNTYSSGLGSGSIEISTSVENLKFYAYEYEEPLDPTPTPPTVGTITLTNVKGSTVDDSLAGLYIAGKSKVHVAAVVNGRGNTIAGVYCSYAGGTFELEYNQATSKYEKDTPQAISGNGSFTVFVNSSGGRGSGSVSLNGVFAYTPPSVTVVEANTYRCDNLGVKEDGGHFYQVDAVANITTLGNQNAVTSFTVGIKNDSTVHDLLTETGPYSGLTDENTLYVLTFSIDDKVSTPVTQEYVLNGAFRDVVIRRSAFVQEKHVHVGIGMTPDDSALGDAYGYTTIQLPKDAKIFVGGQDITAWLRQQIGGNNW